MGRLRLVVPPIVVAASILVGCTGLPGRIRRHTYPPDFKYIPRSELRSAMWQLASDVVQLDDLMRPPGPIDPERRARIRELLTAMDEATSALATHGRPTNHPLIAEHLDEFRQAVATAQAAVAADRPNYYLVGSVAGACLACHGPER
jgi:hypothetical protein